ncbi:MAG TPA: transglutaminase-like domain-containing protein, partial [Vicinamibacteria bacterium]
MKLLRPLPQGLRRPLTVLALVAWAAQMGWLFRVTFKAAPVALAADLARYGTAAQWKGVYYHGEKIGFTVSQTTSTDGGYELREDGRLQMSLLGASTAVRLSTVANVDREFALQDFSFALDPGTGPTEISGSVSGKTLALRIKTPSGERHETRELEAPPALQMNLSRKLAAQGLQEGQRLVVEVFDPATMKNAPLALEIERREVVRVGARPTPVFKMLSRFSGVTSTSWITETGEVVREESPFGLLVVKESPQQAQALAVGHAQIDMLEAAALHPRLPRRIDDPRAVRRLSIRLTGLEAFDDADLEGAGQSRRGDAIEVVDARTLEPTALDPERASFLAPETLLESDAPEIRAEAEKALLGLTGARARAERLVRHVNALLEKKPTISLPSALEVLRTRVGDCNEHTALFVALARASGIPARIAVGLVQLHGAFYYHAWAEVYLEEQGRGLWLPVDPTLNEFPADATHIRLSRGGLEKQAAILGFVGRAQMTVREVDLDATATPILVGAATDRGPLQLPLLPQEGPGRSCWAAPKGNA